MEKLTYARLLKSGSDYLKEKISERMQSNTADEIALQNAELDAWYLLEDLFHLDRAEYLLKAQTEVKPAEHAIYMASIKSRAEGMPLQYIIGHQEFMGFDFEVNPAVLIPRQDTECLVEYAIEIVQNRIKEGKAQKVLDMCTGSGCIIISLAKLLALKQAVGVDISKEALAVAARNQKKHQVDVEWKQSNLFESVSEEQFDLIISNPPYIPTAVIATLMTEVKEREPLLALDGREDGLFYYREIIETAPNYLKNGGQICFEIGCEQGTAVSELLQQRGFCKTQINKDLTGLDRIVSAVWYSER